MRIQNPALLGATLLLMASLAGCNDESMAAEDNARDNAQDNSKVFKRSGVIQCEPDSGTPLEEMQMELVNASIDVICAQVGGDGTVVPTLCGTSAATINIYEIRTANLSDAEAVGFASVMTLPGYIDAVCE